MSRYLGVEVANSGKYYFISYNTEDQEIVAKYIERLGELCVPIWYDYGLKVGTEWETEITEHIKNSEAVILFVSKNIFQKEKSYVHKEYKMAVQYFKKPTFVIKLDEVREQDVPTRYVSWWIDLDNLQCIQAYNFNTVNACVDKIVSEIGYVIPQKFNDVKIQEFFNKEKPKPAKRKTLQVDISNGIPIELLDFLPAKKSGIERISKLIECAYAQNGIKVQVASVQQGTRFNKFYLKLKKGVAIRKVLTLGYELSVKLEIDGVRMDYDFDQNMAYVEVPVSERDIVPLAELVDSKAYNVTDKNQLLLPFGEDVDGKLIVEDLCKMPHLLIAGATGMGKSVFINNFLVGLMMKYTPYQVQFALIDAKMVEFQHFKNSPFLYNGYLSDNFASVRATLDLLLLEIEKRYELFVSLKATNINAYNNFAQKNNFKKLPKIVLIIDEVADCMYMDKNNFEKAIAIIAQKGRGAGIHMILATQRPSVDVISGTIKANIPSRISFRVMSGVDSKVILNESGAERLSKSGDFLYKLCDMSQLKRCQSAYSSFEEISAVINYTTQYYLLKEESDYENCDDLKIKVLKMAIEKHESKSAIFISTVQRNFSVGFNKATRILEELTTEGYLKKGVKYGYRPTITMQEFIEKFGS